MRTRAVVVLVALTALASSACGSSGPPPTPQSSPSSSVSTPAGGGTTAAGRRASPESDAIALKKGLVSPADLGPGWRPDGEVTDLNPTHQPVDRSNPGPAEFCPGHRSELFLALFSDARVVRSFKGGSKGSATVEVLTLPDPDLAALRAAADRDLKACPGSRSTAQDGTVSYDVTAPARLRSVSGGDLVAAWTTQVYRDQGHEQLSSTTQFLVARTGRALTFVAYYPSQFGKNARGEDVAPAAAIVAKQLRRLRSAVPA
jgi:hypothetical protein